MSSIKRSQWRELAIEHYFARLISSGRNPDKNDQIVRSMQKNLEQAQTLQPPLLMYDDRYPCSVELVINADAPEWALIYNFITAEGDDDHILVTGGYDQLAGYMDEIYGRLVLHGYEKTHTFVLNLFMIKHIPDRGKVHVVKTQNPHFTASFENAKPFELRDDDRGYLAGDTLLQREYDPETGYSGRMLQYLITSVLKDYPGLEPGYVILGLQPRQHADQQEADYAFRDMAEQAAIDFFAEHMLHDTEMRFDIVDVELLLGLWANVSRDLTLIPGTPECIGTLRFSIGIRDAYGVLVLYRTVDVPIARGETEWKPLESFICECLSNFVRDVRPVFLMATTLE